MGQTISDLISSLPEEERIVLTLHMVAGKSITDIATLLSVPERAVVVVIESGKKRLASQLGIK